MKRLLQDLNRHSGIRGSAVVAQDGILVVGALPADVQADVVSALVSFLVSSTNRTLVEAQYERFHNMVLTATHGRILLVGLGTTYLVAVTDQFADLDQVTVEVHATARRIQRVSQMHSV